MVPQDFILNELMLRPDYKRAINTIIAVSLLDGPANRENKRIGRLAEDLRLSSFAHSPILAKVSILPPLKSAKCHSARIVRVARSD